MGGSSKGISTAFMPRNVQKTVNLPVTKLSTLFRPKLKKASVQLAIYVIVTLFVASKGRNSTDPALLASHNTSLAVLLASDNTSIVGETVL